MQHHIQITIVFLKLIFWLAYKEMDFTMRCHVYKIVFLLCPPSPLYTSCRSPSFPNSALSAFMMHTLLSLFPSPHHPLSLLFYFLFHI